MVQRWGHGCFRGNGVIIQPTTVETEAQRGWFIVTEPLSSQQCSSGLRFPATSDFPCEFTSSASEAKQRRVTCAKCDLHLCPSWHLGSQDHYPHSCLPATRTPWWGRPAVGAPAPQGPGLGCAPAQSPPACLQPQPGSSPVSGCPPRAPLPCLGALKIPRLFLRAHRGAAFPPAPP